MVYQQKLVAVIKHNGKILREKDNSLVYLPFNSEYEILIKNLESRDCVINISIDGVDVLDKQQLVVRANSSCSLEGFLKNNKVSNRFKFIQKTKKIQDYRGDRVDDGLIRIEYRFTKLTQTVTTTHHHTHETVWFHPYWCECHHCVTSRTKLLQPSHYFSSNPIVHSGLGGGGATYGMSSDQVSLNNINSSLQSNINSCDISVGSPKNSYKGDVKMASVHSNAFMPQFDEGITVKGSESKQKLDQVQVSPLEDQSFTIILKLCGYDKKNQPVEKPILVKSKVKCSTCGRQAKSAVRYCSECGTALF